MAGRSAMQCEVCYQRIFRQYHTSYDERIRGVIQSAITEVLNIY